MFEELPLWLRAVIVGVPGVVGFYCSWRKAKEHNEIAMRYGQKEPDER